MTTTTEIITVDAQALELERAETKVTLDPFVAQAESLKVTNAQQAELATEFVGECARRLRAMESRRTQMKKPILAAGKEIDALFKEMKEPLEQARAAVQPKLLAFHKEEQDRIDAENARIEAERQEQQRLEDERQRKIAQEAAQALADAEASGNEEQAQMAAHNLAVAAEVKTVVPAEKPIEKTNSIKGGSATASVRKRWEARVMDPLSVPREYLVVDQKAINEAMNAAVKHGDIGTFKIPGVLFEQVESLAVKA